MDTAVGEVYCEDCNRFIDINNLCEHYGHEIVNQDEPENKENVNSSNISNNESSFEELLINLIQERPQLWDPSLKLKDKNKSIKDKSWLEIYHFFKGKYSLEELQKKWKNLKDTYVRVKGDIEDYIPSGSGATKKRKIWKHYENLRFLSDHQKNRTATVTNVAGSSGAAKESNDYLPLKETANIGKAKVDKIDPLGEKILEAIKKLPSPPQYEPPLKINPVCLRISELLEKLNDEDKSRAEITLLQTTCDIVFKK